jgi:hypothetical protein
MESVGTYRGFQIRERWRGPDAPGIKMLSDRDAFFQRALTNAGDEPGKPFTGLTANGVVEPGLFSLSSGGEDTRSIRERAREFLASLDDAQRIEAEREVGSEDWRRWSNAFEAPHGASLKTMTGSQREAALAVVKASLSSRGFETVRGAMKLNLTLGELVGNTELLGEWNYAMHIFGSPSADEPWGWQIHGHHLIVSCMVVGRQVVLTPTFVGAEPATADSGKHAGLAILKDEEHAGLRLVNALSSAQQDTAVLFKSIRWADLPPERTHPADGRHRAGAFKDNLVLPYEGLPGKQMTPAQQELLLQLVGVYAGRASSGHAAARMREVASQLDRIHFVWMGGCDSLSPFYYRVHSPVILIEFDHHHGVFLDNDEPEEFHVHTIVRTPNGNDYGRDLLRRHYDAHH